MSPAYLDSEICELIPLWVGIFFNDLCADLEKVTRYKRWWMQEQIQRRQNLQLLKMNHLFASKADFQIWINQVLLISITSKDLFHCLNEGIIHWSAQKKSNFLIHKTKKEQGLQLSHFFKK